MWSVSTGRILGLIPYAHVRNGSVVVKTFYGFSHNSTVLRAYKWVEGLHR
jgi:hypothetical protein